MEENGNGPVPEAAELARRPEVDVVPTAPEDTDLFTARRARIFRRMFMALLVAFLAVGLTGFLGLKSRTTTVEGGGYELSVTYAQVSRGGLATPWSLEVHHPGGFGGPVTISTKTSYLDLFDENGFDPEPSKVTATADEVIWEFEPPDGDTLGVSLDARLEPAVHWGRTGETSVLVDGRKVATARYRTWVMP